MRKSLTRCELVDADKCHGCTNCVKSCPTEAIRVRKGVATTDRERCIYCGKCIRTCPYHAKAAVTDPLDIAKLGAYKCKVALVSSVLYGQFDEPNPENILACLRRLGFDMVFEEALGADAYTIAAREYLKRNDRIKPVISSNCPAVTRLIKIRFPSVVDHIIPLLPPMEMAAKMVRANISKLLKIAAKEIGIFAITPCVAKAAAIRQPIGQEKSYLDGAISLLHVYGKIVGDIKSGCQMDSLPMQASGKAVAWGRSGGETAAINPPNYLVADGLGNVLSVLEQVELGNFENIDYIECHVCHGGSVGGPLTHKNPFLARIVIRDLVKKLPRDLPPDVIAHMEGLYHQGFFQRIRQIQPLPPQPLHPDMGKAIRMVKKAEEILAHLPGLDCGSCGCPSCRTFAEDVARKKSVETDCIFKMLEKIEGSAESTLDLLHKAKRYDKGLHPKK